MIYAPKSAWTTQPGADVPEADVPEVDGIEAVAEGRMAAKVSFREASWIGIGIRSRREFRIAGVLMEMSGSHAHRVVISVAILIKSDRKALPLISPCKRGRLYNKEKGIESSVLMMGNGSGCGGSIPGHWSLRNQVTSMSSGELRATPR
jgi:hypothetical protein